MVSGLNQSHRINVYSARGLAPLLGIMALALLVRILFFSGAIGSDDLTYATKAMDIAAGNWALSDYVVAQRYGVIIPMALFISVFGYSDFAANLFQLMSSLAEIAVLWWIASRFFGPRVANYSALILALLPLHVNLAGRLLAAPPMALFITSAFAFFIYAEETRRIRWYVASGICIGLVFWVKTFVAVLVAPLFLIYAVWVRSVRLEWLWLIGSAACVSLAYVLLLAFLSGDPFYILDSNSQVVSKAFGNSNIDFSAWTYFKYFFYDIKHTGLLGPLALAGIVLLLAKYSKDKSAAYFLFALWGVGLVAILSFGVVSINPLLFVAKINYYMAIFLAPLCLYGAIAVDRVPGIFKALMLTAVIGAGLVLSAFEQQAVRAYMANSVAADQYALEHPDTVFYGGRPAISFSKYWARVRAGNDPDAVGRILPIPEEEPRYFPPRGVNSASDVNLILDNEASNWNRNMGISTSSIPDCWHQVAVLEPTGFGAGELVLSVLRDIAELGPDVIASRVKSATNRLYRPRPAYVYATPSECSIELE